MFTDPNEDIDERIKKLRQANFKLEYKQRMHSGERSVRSKPRGQGQRRRSKAVSDTEADSDME